MTLTFRLTGRRRTLAHRVTSSSSLRAAILNHPWQRTAGSIGATMTPGIVSASPTWNWAIGVRRDRASGPKGGGIEVGEAACRPGRAPIMARMVTCAVGQPSRRPRLICLTYADVASAPAPAAGTGMAARAGSPRSHRERLPRSGPGLARGWHLPKARPSCRSGMARRRQPHRPAHPRRCEPPVRGA
jgi:hypothetical protein